MILYAICGAEEAVGKGSYMALEHVNHRHLKRFAEGKVNLPASKVRPHRERAWRLRERLDQYLKVNPDFELKKILLSGSLAKGTALSDLNDIDMALYVSGADAPSEVEDLLDYLVERLEKAFSPSQIKKSTYSIKVSFKSTDLDIDVVPVIYDDDPDWKGDLVSQDDEDKGKRLMTSIPMHLDFFRERKKQKHPNFAEIVRLIKWWAKERKVEYGDSFRFKSFMIELILCHLWDKGKFNGEDYVKALHCFFDYIVNTDLSDTIIFSDNYPQSSVSPSGLIQIYDPVNPENNVASAYNESHKKKIIDAAEIASDAIVAARRISDEAKTLQQWRKIFGDSFGG